MASSDSEPSNTSEELNHISLERHQLLERKKLQRLFKELRKRAEFGQTEEEASSQNEIDNIDNNLKQLDERKEQLRKSGKNFLNAKDENNKESEAEVDCTSCQKSEPAVFIIEAPPAFPAPTVILDVENLPVVPSRTQCPECQQFIMTETYTSVSSVTWMICWMMAMMGCVLGCCLIPFCLDKFKSTKHRCPRCRTLITTIKKL